MSILKQTKFNSFPGELIFLFMYFIINGPISHKINSKMFRTAAMSLFPSENHVFWDVGMTRSSVGKVGPEFDNPKPTLKNSLG